MGNNTQKLQLFYLSVRFLNWHQKHFSCICRWSRNSLRILTLPFYQTVDGIWREDKLTTGGGTFPFVPYPKRNFNAWLDMECMEKTQKMPASKTIQTNLSTCANTLSPSSAITVTSEYLTFAASEDLPLSARTGTLTKHCYLLFKIPYLNQNCLVFHFGPSILI